MTSETIKLIANLMPLVLILIFSFMGFYFDHPLLTPLTFLIGFMISVIVFIECKNRFKIEDKNA